MLGRVGSPEQKADVLPGLLSGARAAACAARDRSAAGPTAAASRLGNLLPVEAGAQADHLLVAVEHEGAHSQVPARRRRRPDGDPAVRARPRPPLREVRFDDVAVPADAVVGPAGDAAAEVEHALRVACTLQRAETTGVLDKVFTTTLEYLGDRYSFKRALASYQALGTAWPTTRWC